jgi:hypothetical protein
MDIPDLIQGLFGFVGGLITWMNVRQVLKDKRVKGVHWIPTMFFTIWGLWNLYYYPHYGHTLSFVGGLFITLGNAVWVYLLLKYWKK